MEARLPYPQILQRVQVILRRDLKLGADAAIPEEMPFSGSDVDLDSLDILLLVTSIEKEFGVKIPSDAVGKEIFSNVGTLSRFIAQNLNGVGSSSAGSVAAASASPESSDLLERLPHREPFRFITKVSSVQPGESAEGIWSVTGKEAFFAGHFPGNPIVPGVLIAEALAQISGLASAPSEAGGVLAHVDVRFEAPIIPPAEIILRSKLTRTLANLQQFEVSATVTGKVAAAGSITLHRPSWNA